MTVLQAMDLSYEVIGPDEADAVVVLGGISATRHVASHPGNPTPGWWEPVAGEGRAIDTTRHRVIGIDYLDGGCGHDGRPLRIVTTQDQADAIAAVLDVLQIDRLRALVGASYGGMVALAFAERYPQRVERLIVVSAAHEAHPMTTAVRSVQRGIVHLGLTAGSGADALALARGLAITTYRSRREFAARFRGSATAISGGSASFPVESYLRHQGARFAATWEPARFLALSLSADLHKIDPAAIITPTLLVAAEDDTVVPREQLEQLAAELSGPVHIADVVTINGHDAFLTEPEQVGRFLRAALCSPEFP